MNYVFNKDKIEAVLSDFYKSTGIAATLYNARGVPIAKSPEFTKYCCLIRANGNCIKNCDLSDLVHMKEVEASRKISRYTCHAGLMETIMPIIYDGVLIAYLQIGQFADKEGIYSSPEGLTCVAEKYGLDHGKLCALYGSVPKISEDNLTSLYNLMEIIIKFFWVEGVITYNQSIQAVKIENYIAEHLAEEIYIEDICHKFFISKNALYKLFRDEHNTTVCEFITSKRVDAAKKLLLTEPTLNVTEISARCGFASYSYFISTFKNYVGTTPLKYRKNS